MTKQRQRLGPAPADHGSHRTGAEPLERARVTEEPKVPSSAWRQVWTVLSGRPAALALLAVSSIIAGLAESGVLAVLAEVAVALVDKTTRVSFSFGPLHFTAAVGAVIVFGLILALVRLAVQAVLATIPAQISSNYQASLRSKLFAAFTRASWAEQSRDLEGHLQEIVSNQATIAGQSVAQATGLAITALTFFVLVLSALIVNVVAALVVLATAVALFALLRPLVNLNNRYARSLSDASLSFAGGVNEAVRVAEETQVFGSGAAQRARAEELVKALEVLWFRSGRLSVLVPGVYQSLIYLFVVVALGGLYLAGGASVASLGAVVLLLVRAGAYGQQVQAYVQNLEQSLPWLERVHEAQRRYEASRPPDGDERLQRVRSLAFCNVSFEYERAHPVLSAIEFKVSAREAIGVVGPSGVGKSTLVQILLGLREPQRGQYLVNDMPANRFSREDWHRLFAYLPQEPRLLHASVSTNIRFFRSIDDAAVERAARLAGIHDDVMSWPAGYDTLVGPRADAISGGQQQRICLARALAADPEVLILDEPTSALDHRAELRIQESLTSLKSTLTLFVVAHRLSTLTICDRVMIIVDGRIEAFDRLTDLHATSPYYRSASVPGHSVPRALGQG